MLHSQTGLIDARWAESYRITIPASADKTDWATGVYLAKLTPSSGSQSYIMFVVRDDTSTAPFTFQSAVRLSLLGSALGPEFVTGGHSLVLSGPSGTGKTHLAVAVAYRAIQNGFDALFVTAAELIDDLSGAFRRGRLAEALDRYIHPAVVVCDEVGYLTYGTDAANMLFHVVNERHRRRRSMIFTTNKALKAWGRVLHDEDLGQAIIDRVLDRGRLLRLDGPSVRTLHLKLDDAMKDDSDQDDEVATISGNKWPEFPEPTCVVLIRLPDGQSPAGIGPLRRLSGTLAG